MVQTYVKLGGACLCNTAFPLVHFICMPLYHAVLCRAVLSCAGLSSAVSRLESQLGKSQLEKWAQAALLQLGRTNLLMGLAAGGSKSGSSSSKRGPLT